MLWGCDAATSLSEHRTKRSRLPTAGLSATSTPAPSASTMEPVSKLSGTPRMFGTNGYWIGYTPEMEPLVFHDTGLQEIFALEWLRPFAGWIQNLSVSSDVYHWNEKLSRQAQNARWAAEQLGIPAGLLSVAQPQDTDAALAVGQLPVGESAVMYRGRATAKLVAKAAKRPWAEFTECPHEDLREPGRVHLDPLGNLHICQGLVIGNLFEKPLKQICEEYDADSHPICGLLLSGGPAALVSEYNLPHASSYADACHLCYEARRTLRSRFPDILTPDQMYGVSG